MSILLLLRSQLYLWGSPVLVVFLRRICSYNMRCCHTEKEAAQQTRCFILSQCTDTLSTHPLTIGAAAVRVPLSGVALTRKNCGFLRKKSRLRKSENAVRSLYAKKTVTSHIKMRLVFSFFCTQQRRFVEHLPWV